MKTWCLLPVVVAGLLGAPALAQQPTIELTESLLNRVIGGLGTMSDGGVAQPYNVAEVSPDYELCVPMGKIVCPELAGQLPPGFGSNEIPLIACKKYNGTYETLPVGDAVTWQWWVSRPRLAVAANSLKFTATVSTQIGGQWHQETRTVDAAIEFDTASSSLKLRIAPFSVPLELPESNASLGEPPVNVAKLFSITLPVQSQTFAVPLPNGNTRNLTGRINNATAVYLPGRARITLNVSL